MGETYLGMQIYRFYIKCTKCLREITFRVSIVQIEMSPSYKTKFSR